MSSVDNRIVSMKFDNAQFERGVSTTISSMDKLKQSLNFSESQKHLQDLGGAVAKFNMGGMEGSVHGVSKAFIALSTIGITTLSNITSKAVSAGTQLIKSLTISPISSGLHEYETNLGSIQTILSNTQHEGATLKDVNRALKELNEYSDQTIYNFSEMARNIGTFTAAGVKLKPATSAIKGIANLAALSGSNAEQASTAMYQLSQAISAGRVSLQDWNSVVNAGMGGKVFQDALKRTARAHGVAVDDIIKKQGSFRESLSKGWLSSTILTETLSQMTGDLTDKQLKSMGYTAQQIKDIQKTAKTAKDAATKVKTMSQLIDTLQETAGSGWADTWSIILGDFGEAKTLFTSLNESIGGWIKSSADARNKILGDWKKLGGRTHLIEGLKNIFTALGRVLGPIKEAFRDIFPPMTGQRLYDLTLSFENFTKKLKISDTTMENLKSTFKGIFAIFSILKQVSHGVFKIISSVFEALSGPTGSAGGGFLALTANIGDFISGIDEMLKKTKVIDKFFGAIGGAIAAVITIIADVGKAFAHLFTGGDISFFDDLSNQFKNLSPIIEDIQAKIQDIMGAIKNLLSRFHVPSDLFGITTATDNASESLDNLQTSVVDTTGFLDGFKKTATKVASAIGAAFKWIWDALKNITSGVSLEEALATINTGFFILLYRNISKFFKSMNTLVDKYGDMIEHLGTVFKNFGGVLKGMQQDLKAEALMKVAIALLVLVAAIWLLSFLEPADIARGIASLAAMFLVLNTAMKALDKGLSNKTLFQMYALSGAMIVLAVALTAMAGAVLAFGKMDIETLKKGFGSVVAVMVIVAGGMIAVKAAGGPKALAGTAGGLMLMAVALTMLAGVVLLFDKIDLETMISGLIKMAGVLLVIAGFMWLISGLKMSGSLVGLISAAIAMHILAGALKELGNIGMTQLAKGLGAMGIALAIIATAMWVMETTLPGAAALLVTVFALKLLIPVIRQLGEMDWKTVAKGLGFLAAAFAVVAIGGWLLLPVIPIIALFAASVALVGIAMFAAGVGMLAFATGLAILSVSGAAGIAVLTAAIITFVELLPLIGQQIGLAFVSFAVVIGEKAPLIVKALGKLLSAMLDELKKRAPKFYRTMIDLLIDMINAIAEKLPDFVEAVISLIEAFVDTFGSKENVERITTAAADLVINFLNGLSATIDKKSQEFVDAGKNISASIIKGMVIGLTSTNPVSMVAKAATNLGKSAAEAMRGVLGIGSPSKVFIDIGENVATSLALGIDKYSNAAVKSTEEMGDKTISTIATVISQITDTVDFSLNSEPVITPVLDLTKIRKTASTLQDTLTVSPIIASVTYQQASDIASSKQPVEEQIVDMIKNIQPNVNFEQNNYSPKALSPSEIYRNTRNQLMFAKELMAE